LCDEGNVKARGVGEMIAKAGGGGVSVVTSSAKEVRDSIHQFGVMLKRTCYSQRDWVSRVRSTGMMNYCSRSGGLVDWRTMEEG
jgi:hypothetical protein